MNETPEKPRSEWRSPQALAPIVAAVCTVLVAVIGLLSNQMRANPVPVATVVVTVPVTQAPVESESTAVPTQASTSAPAQAATVVSQPPTSESVTAIATASETANITLFYDEDAFTVFNSSDSPVSIEDVSFRAVGQDDPWDMSVWGNLADAIPPQQCIRLRDIAEESQEPPSACPEEFYGFFKVGSGEVYWRDVSQFEVIQDDTVLATCEMAAGTCSFYVEP